MSQPIYPGENLIVAREVTVYPFRGSRRSYRLDPGEELIVTSVRDSAWPNCRVMRGQPTDAVLRVPASALMRPEREIGVMPTEGEHIAVDDDRIQWIFKDAARLAQQTGKCRDYDDLTDRLNIPGRPRKFKVSMPLSNGLKVTGEVVARSQQEAERMVAGELQARISSPQPLELEARVV